MRCDRCTFFLLSLDVSLFHDLFLDRRLRPGFVLDHEVMAEIPGK